MIISDEIRIGWVAGTDVHPEFGALQAFESRVPAAFTWLPGVFDWWQSGQVRIWRGKIIGVLNVMRPDLPSTDYDIAYLRGHLCVFAEDEITVQRDGRWWIETPEFLKWRDRHGRPISELQASVGWTPPVEP